LLGLKASSSVAHFIGGDGEKWWWLKLVEVRVV
jgi:hypothetical protein